MNKHRPWLGVIGLGLSALLLAQPASAYTIAPSCDTCQGMGVDINYSLSGDGLTASFTFTTTFTTGAWSGWTMDALSLQFDGGSSSLLDTSYLVAASSTAAGTWTRVYDKVSGNGCDGTFDGAVCFTVMPTGSGSDNGQIIGGTGSTYTWTFDVKFTDAAAAAASLARTDHSVKFLALKFNNGKWSTGAQLSESTGFGCRGDCGNKVPEPGTLALFGLGLLGLGLARRRRAA